MKELSFEFQKSERFEREFKERRRQIDRARREEERNKRRMEREFAR